MEGPCQLHNRQGPFPLHLSGDLHPLSSRPSPCPRVHRRVGPLLHQGGKPNVFRALNIDPAAISVESVFFHQSLRDLSYDHDTADPGEICGTIPLVPIWARSVIEPFYYRSR